MYHEVSEIVCFWTFSVKRKEMIFIENMFFGRPCGKCIFTYNFIDKTKFMILFHLQRLGAEHIVSYF